MATTRSAEAESVSSRPWLAGSYREPFLELLVLSPLTHHASARWRTAAILSRNSCCPPANSTRRSGPPVWLRSRTRIHAGTRAGDLFNRPRRELIPARLHLFSGRATGQGKHHCQRLSGSSSTSSRLITVCPAPGGAAQPAVRLRAAFSSRNASMALAKSPG
jgi:hypothetical protein